MKTAVLTRSLAAWGTLGFATTLKEEIVRLGAGFLPLQEGLRSGSTSLDTRLDAMILRTTAQPDFIQVRAGIFYSSVVSGCSCADDPTPIDENSEYCEVELVIDRESGETRATLVQE